MSFWSRGRQHNAEAHEPTAAAPIGTPLSLVEIWGATHRTLAGMDLSRGRLTDILNHEDTLPAVLLDEVPENRAQPLPMQPRQEWTQLPIEDALLVLPPPQPANPLRRLHRPKQPVQIVIGPFVISGMVHTPPGAQAAAFLIRQNARFVPVTQAAVHDTGLDGFEQRADVVLVNMRLIDKIQDVGLDQPEPLPSPEVSVRPLA